MFQTLAASLCVVSLFALPNAALAGPQQRHSDSQRPGLVASFQAQGSGALPVEVLRVEPTVAFRFLPDESPHPRLPAAQWSAHWDGQLQILRGGSYRFAANLGGNLQVSVGDQEVFRGAGDEQTGNTIVGPEVKLAPGTHRFVVQFVKTRPEARVQLFWQSEHFPREPLPWHVLSHQPADAPPALRVSQQQDRGRFLAEEFSCTACHRPAPDNALAAGLAKRQGPDLSQVGRRAFAGWIFHWLEDPRHVRPQAVMPRLFTDDETGRVQRYAVAAYLASLGGPLPPQRRRPKNVENLRERGRQTFRLVGCAVCHASDDDGQPPADLTGLGSKTTPERLAEFLADPLAVDPSGRMPDMSLSPDEARDLAYALCESKTRAIALELPAPPSEEAVVEVHEQIESDAAERERFTGLAPEAQWLALGKRLLTEKGCANCHRIAPDGAPLPSSDNGPTFAALRSQQRQQRGCLHRVGRSRRDSPAQEAESNDIGRPAAPRFALAAADRDALRTFLTHAATGPGTSAPTFVAHATLERFRCLGCHQRNGQGGLSPEALEDLRELETAQDAEQIKPPPLTEVGDKLQTPWLRAVLSDGRRARPWMALRMPQFGRDHVDHLPEALAACDGVIPGEQARQFEYDPDAIKVGRFLVGTSAFGCIGCHDIAGRPSSGTRGPDLASMRDRVRYDWYLRWLYDAQRMQPGTRMPTVFPGGRSPLRTLLGGSGAAQADAIWQYLSLGENLPLPEGVETREALALEPNQRVLVVRTFMPEAGNRALAVGFPGGVSFAFDAAACRLAYGWTGAFLDAAPTWDARGGRPAGVLGPRFWTAPPGFPWAVTITQDGEAPPDWSKRASDPTLGAPLPEGTLSDQPPRLQFRGYQIDQTGTPTFQYALTQSRSQSVEVRERIEPQQQLAGVGVARHFTVHLGQNQAAWHLLGESHQPIRLLDRLGRSTEPLSHNRESPARGTHLLLDARTERPLLVSLADGPASAKWVVRQEHERWYAMLRVGQPAPATEAPRGDRDPLKLSVRVWAPYRNDPAMIRDLIDRGLDE